MAHRLSHFLLSLIGMAHRRLFLPSLSSEVCLSVRRWIRCSRARSGAACDCCWRACGRCVCARAGHGAAQVFDEMPKWVGRVTNTTLRLWAHRPGPWRHRAVCGQGRARGRAQKAGLWPVQARRSVATMRPWHGGMEAPRAEDQERVRLL